MTAETGSARSSRAHFHCDPGQPRARRAGLHPATGGDGTQLRSGDMLLQALAACAGVTSRAVATAIGLEVRGGSVHAEGELRPALAVDADADAEQPATLQRLAERYCVVHQTLRTAPDIEVALRQCVPATLAR